MISIRKYLDGSVAVEEPEAPKARAKRAPGDLLSLCVGAYRSALAEIGRSSVDACAATGPELAKGLETATAKLAAEVSSGSIAEAGEDVKKHAQEWGRRTARHFQQKADEVKEILLVMASTAESVGERDQRCAAQINDVTAQLRRIANLDDISQIRRSIENSASELKTSIDRMTAEGKAVLDALQAKVTTFQAKLDEAEKAASCDALTRLRNRLWVEGQIEQRIARGASFCVAILDIDGFKGVNDQHGHVVGDEVLKQFATELRSACRASDIVGRWGGDEFMVVFDCVLAQAEAQIERVSKWVCGSYTLEGAAGALKLRVDASIGLAEFAAPEGLKQLLDRADAAMYRNKAAARNAPAKAEPGKTEKERRTT